MNDILLWLSNNVSLVSALTSLMMVFVWLFYANLFFRDFRSRHHPRMLVHQAPDNRLDSMCFVVNMSGVLVNIVGVFACDRVNGRTVEITDYRHYTTPDEVGSRELKSVLKQGPLGEGQFLQLGTFEKIVSMLSIDPERCRRETQEIELRVALFHGSSRLPVGARRAFSVGRRAGSEVEVRPTTFRTVQMTSLRERRRVLEWLRRGTFPH
ncbi:MAG: hypothetical protein ACOCW3_05155 [Spirochaetota bacterium]